MNKDYDMKKNIILSGLLAVLLVLVSCSKEEIMLYEEATGVYFNNSSTTYNFIEHAGNIDIGNDTINIPILLTGTAVGYDRPVKMEVAVDDTLLTAEKGMYEILGGGIPANEYAGQIKVQVNYSKALDDSIYVARFRIVPNEHFAVTDLNRITYSLNITNKFTQPANWGRLSSAFGNYSNSWYAFILKVTGLSSIPYWSYRGSEDPSNPDPERWTMTYNERQAYAAKVKVELTKYNNTHPGNPLLHEDGKYKGKQVVMP